MATAVTHTELFFGHLTQVEVFLKSESNPGSSKKKSKHTQKRVLIRVYLNLIILKSDHKSDHRVKPPNVQMFSQLKRRSPESSIILAFNYRIRWKLFAMLSVQCFKI